MNQPQEKPLVSIVTIVYNGEKHLERAIQSVVNQGYKNIEYIIIDGGSTDKTLEIIKKYEDKINCWISEPDEGIADAFNKGIAVTKGKIIGLLNADDWYEPNAVETVIQHLDKGDIFYGNLQYWKEGKKDYLFYAEHQRLKSEMTVNHPTVFVKKNIYEKFGTFDISYKYAMDYELMLRFYIKKVKFFYINKVISNMHLGGLSDREYIGALREARKAKNIYLGNRLTNYLYFLKQVIWVSFIRMIPKALYYSIIAFYRKRLSPIKKVMAKS